MRLPGVAALIGRLERLCLWLTQASLAAMVLIIVVEVVLRAVAGTSLQMSDEYGGYLLVAASFLALAPAQSRRAFHSVEIVQHRLGARWRARAQKAFAAVSLAFALLLAGAIVRYVAQSWSQGDSAPTLLGTPLWIPQCAMAVGMVALCLSLAASLFGAGAAEHQDRA